MEMLRNRSTMIKHARVSALVCALVVLSAAPLPAQAPSWKTAPPASAAHAMVVTEQHDATAAGVDVLKRGGNAVDAAIAVAYALAVVDPCCGNIGGGGFMLVRMHDGRERFIDFREKAPARATPRMYLDRNGDVVKGESTKGYLAAGVPGTVMGLERAREEFATMPRGTLMRAAIDLAQNGFVVRPGDAQIFREAAAADADTSYTFARQPNVRAIFMKNGKLPGAGDLLKQPQLAATLRLIAAQGANAFYKGAIARTIVREADAHGGLLARSDFENYSVDELQPIHCRYRGYDVLSVPPPSSGGITLCETLNVLSAYPLGTWGWNTPQSTHYIVEAERRTYADRNTYLGDPAFVKNPIAQLLSPGYAVKLRMSIKPDAATPSTQVHPGLGSLAHENG